MHSSLLDNLTIVITNVSLSVYVIKREYESEEEGGEGRRFAVLGPKKVTGVGPTTKDGVPTTLKSVCPHLTSSLTATPLTLYFDI